MTVLETAGRWLPLRSRSGEGLPLFCLPHAGGSASAYAPWLGRVPGARVLPVQPPAREGRLREPAFTRMADLVDELADVVLGEVSGGGPWAVYGHSHGGLVGFELLREVRRRGGPMPVQFVVSGCAAPHCGRDRGAKVTRMNRREVVAMLRKLGGTPEWLLADDGALDMILPAVLGDFGLREGWRYAPEAPLDVPLTVLSSTDDPRARPDRQARWAEQTSGPFALHTLTGGHFAVFEQAARTQALLAGLLAPWTASWPVSRPAPRPAAWA